MEPRSKTGIHVVEIPAPIWPLLAARLETPAGVPNPLDLVFPSETGTPLDPKNVRRRHFAPALKPLGPRGIRQHDTQRTFIAIHVEAGMHPKFVQDRVGHSSIRDIRLTMDVYGKMAGKMRLGTDEEMRPNALGGTALPAQGPDQPPPEDTPQHIRKLRLHGRTLLKALVEGKRAQPQPERV